MVPSAPLRRHPSPRAGIDTEALIGDAVTFYAEEDGHAFVQLARDGYVGYLPAESLGSPDPEPTHVVMALRTFLYPAPDLKTPPLGHLSLGARIAVTGRSGDYAETARGFVFAGHINEATTTVPDYAGTAARLVGTPYLWGDARASASIARASSSSASTSPGGTAPGMRTCRSGPSARPCQAIGRPCQAIEKTSGGATSCSGGAMSG